MLVPTGHSPVPPVGATYGRPRGVRSVETRLRAAEGVGPCGGESRLTRRADHWSAVDMRGCPTADEQCSSLRGEPSFPSQKKPRRVRARRREKNSIRFLPGRVPGKKHFSARKRANRPLGRPICALQRAASSFLQRPLAFVRKNSPGCPGEPLRVCRAGSIVTCTHRQVGRLSSVSLLPTSGQSREACNPQIQIGIPYKRCGFHEPQV